MIKNVVIWSDHVAGASIRYLARPCFGDKMQSSPTGTTQTHHEASAVSAAVVYC